MSQFARSISLVDPPAAIVLVSAVTICALVAALGFFDPKKRPRTSWALIISLVLTAVVWLVLEKIWRPFPDPVPLRVYLASAASAFVVLSALVVRGWRIRLILPAVLSIAAAWGCANLVYQQYPTLASLHPAPQAVRMDYQEFQKLSLPPTIDGEAAGALVSIPATGEVSGFKARDAVAYVPPAYWTKPELKLPVLVLMAGNPGQPMQWFSNGQGEITADNYQAQHDGIAPVIISVDATGSLTANPLCIDGPEDQVQTYLSRDVPELIHQHFPRINPDQRSWTIGGLSYGGTCALQVITNSPRAYGNFLNFSGQAEPTIGSHKETLDRFFGGSEQAFEAINPATILSRAAADKDQRFRGIAGRFVAGERDQSSGEALAKLNDLTQQVGMRTEFTTVPGAHSYEVWRVALRENLDWVVRRGGINP